MATLASPILGKISAQLLDTASFNTAEKQITFFFKSSFVMARALFAIWEKCDFFREQILQAKQCRDLKKYNFYSRLKYADSYRGLSVMSYKLYINIKKGNVSLAFS